MIDDAVPEAKAEIRQRNVEKLTADQQVLYEVISAYEKIAPGQLYDEYQSRAEEPKSNRMVRNYLQKMERYNLLNAEGKNRGRIYTTK